MTKVSSAPGLQRFNFYLQQLQPLLDKASASDNPAKLLYEQGARTPIFMLEALARMYEKIHNKKIFGKQKVHFKLLEDMLGEVDYYDCFQKELKTVKKIPAAVKTYLQEKTEEKIAALNAVLAAEGWIRNDDKRMMKIASKLKKADWLDEAEDAAAIKKQYGKIIEGIIESIATNKINFDNVEDDVHELRRQLRWLSIYPQCFQGLFQLKAGGKPTAAQRKYLTKEITGSAFNKMPAKGKLQNTILLNANNFYALSWMIADLGKLKDSGLQIEVLTEALMVTTKSQEKQAIINATKLGGPDQKTMQEILSLAKTESDQFFNEGLLAGLVVE
ncbi:MAG: hypothetical protein ABIX01_04420 [Chitinophagaceae bacterium]